MESDASLSRFFTRIKKSSPVTSTVSPEISLTGRSKSKTAKMKSKEKKEASESTTNKKRVSKKQTVPISFEIPDRLLNTKGRKVSLDVPQSHKDSHGEKMAYNTHKARKMTFADWKKGAAGYLPSNTRRPLKLKKGPVEANTQDRSSQAPGEAHDGSTDLPTVTSASDFNLPTFSQLKRKRVEAEHDLTSTIESFRKTKGILPSAIKIRKTFTSVDEEIEEVFGRKSIKEELSLNVESQIKEKMNTLKELSISIDEKRVLRRKLLDANAIHADEEGNLNLDSNASPLRDTGANCARLLDHWYHNFINWTTIWENDLTEINSRFGNVIASYFIWLRRIVKLNFFMFIVSLCFLILPEFIENNFQIKVQDLEVQKEQFHWDDLLNGEGYFHNSLLYYSGYHNRYPDAHPNRLLDNAAIRFCFAILIIGLINTKMVIELFTRHYRNLQMETKVMDQMETFKGVICAWDFSCGDAKAAKFLHKMIKQDLYILSKGSQEADREMAEIETKENYRLLALLVKYLGLRCGDYMMHIIINFIGLVCCAVHGTMIFYLCKWKLEYYLECITIRDDGVTERNLTYNVFCPDGDLYLETWVLSIPALFTCIVSLVLTKFLISIGEMEHFRTPEFGIMALMIRGGIFHLTSISVFFLFWNSWGDTLRLEGYVAETVLGKEMYRLVVIQGIIDFVINFCSHLILHLIRRAIKKDYKKPKFQPEYCAQEMFFINSIASLGTMFCPLISLLVNIRFVADFYQKKYILMRMSSHETNVARGSSVFAPYLWTFFLSYIITGVFFLIIFMNRSIPSYLDGPFVHYNESYFEVIRLYVESESTIKWMRALAQPGFLWILCLILCSMVYFFRELGKAYEPIQDQISELIMFERADKEILLKAYFEIAQDIDAPEESQSELSAAELRKKTLAGKMHDKIDKLIHTATTRRQTDHVGEKSLSHESGQQQNNRARHHRKEMENIVNEIVEDREGRKGVVMTTRPSSKALDALIQKQLAKMGHKEDQD